MKYKSCLTAIQESDIRKREISFSSEKYYQARNISNKQILKTNII